MDFHPEIDTLLLDPTLWSGTRTVEGIVATFGTVTGGHAVFDFGDGQQLTIENLNDLSALSDSLGFL